MKNVIVNGCVWGAVWEHCLTSFGIPSCQEPKLSPKAKWKSHHDVRSLKLNTLIWFWTHKLILCTHQSGLWFWQTIIQNKTAQHIQVGAFCLKNSFRDAWSGEIPAVSAKRCRTLFVIGLRGCVLSMLSYFSKAFKMKDCVLKKCLWNLSNDKSHICKAEVCLHPSKGCQKG